MVYSPTPIPGPLGWGWGGRPPKKSRTLEKSRVLWCGKQDLNCPIALKIIKKSSIFNQFGKFLMP
jgi:hypothetical protein